MDVIFLKILNMSIAAIWPIAAVLLLRIFLKRAPKWINCVLWGIAALRLICPFALKTPFSLIPSVETFDMNVIQYASNPTVNTGITALNRILNPVISKAFAPTSGASVNPLYVRILIAGIIWAAGTLLLLFYAIFRYIQLRRRIQEAIPFLQFPIQKGQTELKKGTSIWLCDAVRSPFIFGIIKPGIYLPSDISKENITYVVAHEQAHLRRKDHWWKLLGYFLLTMHWFNPLVWTSYFLFCQDMELACDEKVIRNFDIAEKKAYANALVSCSIQRKLVFSCPPAFGEVHVKERVKAVLKYKKVGTLLTAASLAICAVAAVCFLSNPPVSIFRGSRTGNDSEFIMDYKMLNTTDSQELILKAGDSIDAMIIVEDGRLAVTIRKDDDTPIYANRNLISSAQFGVEIEESGVYTVEVTGTQAKGSVRFVQNNH